MQTERLKNFGLGALIGATIGMVASQFVPEAYLLAMVILSTLLLVAGLIMYAGYATRILAEAFGEMSAGQVSDPTRRDSHR
jgi:uncharacterized membrane protein YccC